MTITRVRNVKSITLDTTAGTRFQTKWGFVAGFAGSGLPRRHGGKTVGICNDPATTYLRRLGYNVVRHPESGIQPGELIGRQGKSVRRLGSIESLITSSPITVPGASKNDLAADLSGQESSNLKVAIGVSVLGNFISAMGGDLGIKAEYERARKLKFVFNEVLTDSMVPLEVGNYLRDAEIDTGNPVLEQYVLGNGELFLITKTLKSKKFGVIAEGSDGVSLDLDVPAIQAALSAEGSITVTADSESMITYEGSVPLVFGFQSFIVGVSNGDLTLISAQADHVALSSDSAYQTRPAMLTDGALLEFE